jgi:subtilisin family serine protease
LSRPALLSIALALFGALGAPSALAATEAPAPTTPPATFVPGKVIVEWTPGADRVDKVAAREEAEVGDATNLGDQAFQLVGVDSGQTVASAIAELKADPAVAVAERDGYNVPTSIPDDPLFGQEWALENTGAGVDGFSGGTAGADIKAPGAWDRTVGTPSAVVADIDSGYRFDSPDLGPVAWENTGETPGNGIDDDGNGYADDVHGYDFVGQDSENPSEDADPTDDDLISGGHGVHTAGTIGAAGDNEVGISGVAQDARIMPLRVCSDAPTLDESRCPISSTIAAINYAGQNGAQVANMSLSGGSNSTAELDALAENPQTLYVIAAGNDSQDNDSVGHYPCNFEPGTVPSGSGVENVVCVAATDQADQLASFSDWGHESVDLGAPGTQILSTYPTIESLISDDFEQNDFETRWKSTGTDGGFERTNEAPLTSFGISDSPGAAPVPNSSRSSTLSSPVAVPAGYGSCRLSGRDSVSLGGGTFNLIIFKNGVGAFNFEVPSTAGSQMASFTTKPMTGLAESNVGVRVRYIAGPSPTASSGVWLDDLELSCYAPLSTPPSYEYLQGTSMAAPQVSGTAALLFSEKPAASTEEVRDALLSSVDADPSLAGKTVSGGRLDAARALAYLEPPAPLLTSTDPASPAEDADPRIVGSVAAGSRVLLFSGAGCLGPAETVGTAAELASPGLSVHVPDETTEQFSAIVETHFNSSPCSAPISYTNSTKDESAPAAPVLSSTDPVSPADENHPKIVGSAEAGSNVEIYSDPLCEESPVADGSAAELASPGIEVTVADNTETQFWATATDAADNTSACSAPISYTNTAKIGPGTVIIIGPPPFVPPPSPPASCTVPKLAGKTLAQAKAALREAGCTLGKATKPKPRKGRRTGALVVKSSSPGQGDSTSGAVSIKLGPKLKKHHR